MSRHAPFLIGALLAWTLAGVARGTALHDARVITDEIITTTTPAGNGSSPMWSAGAPLLVRRNGDVWASISVHDPDAEPYCNTHWELWSRPADGPWTLTRRGPAATEREPCPLSLLDSENLVLSIHPRVLAKSQDGGGGTTWYCQPALAVFDPADVAGSAHVWTPDFGAMPTFHQHSYRGVGVNTATGSLLLMVIDSDNAYWPTRRDSSGAWHALRAPAFPIRAAYPQVALGERSGHILAIGDIVEPNETWKAEKYRVLESKWDYVFRRLFYTWSPDLAAEGFREPVEIDSVEDTAGWMFNLDLVVDAQGRAHLLWVRRTFDHGFLGERFFPGAPNVETVVHAVVDQGRVVARATLARREIASSATNRREFTSGRFHLLPDGRLLAVLIAPGTAGAGGLLLQELDREAGPLAAPVLVPLARPPPTGSFFTNTVRGGSEPDHHLDLLCAESAGEVISLRYIHVFIP